MICLGFFFTDWGLEPFETILTCCWWCCIHSFKFCLLSSPFFLQTIFKNHSFLNRLFSPLLTFSSKTDKKLEPFDQAVGSLTSHSLSLSLSFLPSSSLSLFLSFFLAFSRCICPFSPMFCAYSRSWRSLVVGGEGCIGPSRKLLCLCQTPKNYAAHAWHYLIRVWLLCQFQLFISFYKRAPRLTAYGGHKRPLSLRLQLSPFRWRRRRRSQWKAIELLSLFWFRKVRLVT